MNEQLVREKEARKDTLKIFIEAALDPQTQDDDFIERTLERNVRKYLDYMIGYQAADLTHNPDNIKFTQEELKVAIENYFLERLSSAIDLHINCSDPEDALDFRNWPIVKGGYSL